MAQPSKRKQSRSFEDSEVAILTQVIVQGEAVQGRWTKDEHQRFVEALSIHGKNWKKVEEHVGTRSGAQIRSHAQKFFNRLEKEFNKQFNGLKSSEIKQIFENNIQHYSEGDVTQKRQRTGSINDISEDDNQGNLESMQIESNQLQLQHQLQQVKMQLQQGILDLNLPDSCYHQNAKDQVTKYQQQQNKLQKKMQDVVDRNYSEELIKEICELHKEKDQIIAIQQIQNAYQSIAEVNQLEQQQSLRQQQPQQTQPEHQQTQKNSNQLNEESRPGTDESFFHFIMARNQKYINNRKLSLSDLIEVPKQDEKAQESELLEQKQQQQQENEGQRSRKQSFTFYNDQVEDNELRYQTLKKNKKEQ
ncbi:unnamed protein product (macronuclear) [Paramecium tetraurelia]|uniref:Uncharacterized protein n=1 Tax=Paramecium tetraurelia TaxID=5888 RepID=A0BGN1_PARTE|nr:uncharacterized protein GSPATT00028733001 [Paramecium tetraurelia]CAK57698.1 unnamed protein product [Paramecium tetraurelia]|eukprot:XP_001425096.1 hypothetical protein (macronuclear) [Paramecium tetraurelia strain d4-2]